LKAITQNGMSLRLALLKFQSDIEVVLQAVDQNGESLQYASKEL